MENMYGKGRMEKKRGGEDSELFLIVLKQKKGTSEEGVGGEDNWDQIGIRRAARVLEFLRFFSEKK